MNRTGVTDPRKVVDVLDGIEEAFERAELVRSTGGGWRCAACRLPLR